MDIVRRIALKAGNDEFILPITPESYQVANSVGVETVNITSIGDVRIAGYPGLDTIKISSFFPAQAYSFSLTSFQDPWVLVSKLQNWQSAKTVVRFIVTGTTINKPVLIEDIYIGEQDGSNDVYYTLTLSEYRFVSSSQTVSSQATAHLTARAVETSPTAPQTYTVVSGDCLRHIARRFYGDQSYYKQIAEQNGIKNPDLIYPGDVLTLPGV